MKFLRFTLPTVLLLSVRPLRFGGNPPGRVPDRTAVRPGEPVSVRLTLSTVSPTVVIVANDVQSKRWFAVQGARSRRPLSRDPIRRRSALARRQEIHAGIGNAFGLPAGKALR